MQILEVRQDPSGKKKQKPKNTFKRGLTKEQCVKYGNPDDIDRKINDLLEENKMKILIKEQVSKIKDEHFK